MRVLLLGQSGQVGFELKRLYPDAVAPTRAEVDLTDPQAAAAKVRELRPDVIVNAGAYTAVDNAEKEPALAQAVNAEAPGVLAQEAAKLGALLVHYSTDYVFDGAKRSPYREDDPTGPTSAYGRSKLAGEQAIRASDCRHLILRTSWVYAARGKNFVLTMLRLAREKPELRVVSDQVGSPTWSRSLAQATAQAVERALAGKASGTYHATNAGAVSWHGFAERIVERGAALGLCPRIPVKPITTAEYPTPARRPAYSVLDCGRLSQELGIRLPPWEKALDDCLEGVMRASGGAFPVGV